MGAGGVSVFDKSKKGSRGFVGVPFFFLFFFFSEIPSAESNLSSVSVSVLVGIVRFNLEWICD